MDIAACSQGALHNRKHLVEKEGKTSIPYLYDPNTEEGLFESQSILEYLQEAYSGDSEDGE